MAIYCCSEERCVTSGVSLLLIWSSLGQEANDFNVAILCCYAERCSTIPVNLLLIWSSFGQEANNLYVPLPCRNEERCFTSVVCLLLIWSSFGQEENDFNVAILAAMQSGVAPLFELLFLSDPASVKKRTTCMCPPCAARKRAVYVNCWLLAWESFSAPASTSIRAHCKLPSVAATWRGYKPSNPFPNRTGTFGSSGSFSSDSRSWASSPNKH